MRLVTALICRACAWQAGTPGRASLGGRYTEPADALRFQIGANATDMDTIAVTFVDVVDIAHLPAWVARDFASDMAAVFRRICALSRDIFRFLTLGLLGLGGGDLSFFLVYIGLRWQSDAISK